MSGHGQDKTRFEQARDAFVEGNYEDAQALLMQFLRENPGNPQALKNLTSVKIKIGNRPTKDEKQLIRSVYSLYDKGYDYYREKNYDECLACFNQVEVQANDSGLIEHFVVTIRDLISEIELEREVQENNLQIQNLFDEGKLFFNDGLYDECIEKMMSVLSIDPGHEAAVQYINEAAQLKEP